MIVNTDTHRGAPVNPLPPDHDGDRWHRWEGLPEALALLFSVAVLCGAALFLLSLALQQRGLSVLCVP